MMKRLSLLLVVLTLLSLPLPTMPAHAAGWSGSQTVTWEYLDAANVVTYTAVLEYDFTEDWVATLALDIHQRYGAAFDVSTTMYTPWLEQIYVTAGVRRPGREAPRRQWTPYISATYRF